ncbi:MAG: tRNA (adenosine(37)-N6)-threonylcarbamoyltransferase complex ATPase subunit type 1 TsaE [Chitinophagaceae bacterium]
MLKKTDVLLVADRCRTFKRGLGKLLTFAANRGSAMAEWKFTLDKLPATAADLLQRFGTGRVFAFHGQMGAGKTTFIHALCAEMDVSGTVSSPTFSIINEYGYRGGLVYHIDLYRLKDEEEALRAGVEDCLYSGNTCLVEWPERAPAIFPDDTIHVYLEAADEQTRLMRVEDK